MKLGAAYSHGSDWQIYLAKAAGRALIMCIHEHGLLSKKEKVSVFATIPTSITFSLKYSGVRPVAFVESY